VTVSVTVSIITSGSAVALQAGSIMKADIIAIISPANAISLILLILPSFKGLPVLMILNSFS
jgi:hypothetical protein